MITEAGFGDYFGHNTGHAIGIEVHEDPRFSPRDTTTLQLGMLLTVEPGIYLPGQGACASKMLCWLPRKAQKCSTPCRKQCCSRERHNGFIAIKALSEADAIASSEQEVRQILLEEADRLQKKCDLMVWDRC